MSDETRGPREIAYDTEIEPLMRQVFRACQRSGITMLATFELDAGASGPIYASSAAGQRLGRMARAEAILLGDDAIIGDPNTIMEHR